MIEPVRQAALNSAADIRYRAIWLVVALANFGAVIFGNGDLINLAAGMLAAAWITYGWQQLAITNHRADTVAHDEQQREHDIQWWIETALTSTGVNERKAAVDMLAYWRHPLHINPLVEPPAPRGISPQPLSARASNGDFIDRWQVLASQVSKPYTTITMYTHDQEK